MQRTSMIPLLEQELSTMQLMLNDNMQYTYQLQRRVCVLEDKLQDDTRASINISGSLLDEVRTRMKAELLEELRARDSKVSSLKSEQQPEQSNAKRIGITSDEAPLGSQQEVCHAGVPQYSFQESVWDLSIFIGHPKYGNGGTVVVGILLLLTVVMQIAFCVICQLNFTNNPFNEEARSGLREFRLRYAHNVLYTDRSSAKNLAQQICDADADKTFKVNKLFYGTSQVNTLEAIRSYRGTQGSFQESVFGGETLCLLALGCWVLTVFKSFQRVHHLLHAILGVPVESSTHFEVSPDDDCVVLKSVSLLRKLLVLLMILLRLACYGLLLYSGGAWLSYTTDAQNLVLNAAALEFVLNIDELLFIALAPEQSKLFLSEVSALPETRWGFYGGLDFHSLGCFILFPVITFSFFLYFVQPLVQDMQQSERILCGANLEFVYARDKDMGMMWFTGPGDLAALKAAEHMTSTLLDSVAATINGTTPVVGNTVQKHPYEKVKIQSIGTQTTAEISDMINVGCLDTALTLGTYLPLVRIRSRNNSIKSCADLAQLCLSPHNVVTPEFSFLRTLCPESCGCVSPLSIVPNGRTDFGCPSSCLTSKQYLAQLANLPCNDTSPRELRASDFWPVWVAYADEHLKDIFSAGGLPVEKPYDHMMLYGCEFFQFIPKGELLLLCEGHSALIQMRPIGPVCPQTCECASGMVRNCAPRCTPLFNENVSVELRAMQWWN